MKILFLSCHATLEYDEVKLLTELGHNVFSMGSYINPESPHDKKRPGFKGFYDDHLQAVAIQCSKENLHPELVNWADVIIVMHRSDWIMNNWGLLKGKRVIWRSIGQSVPQTEGVLSLFRSEGMQIVRYSPAEREILNFLGEDAIIRFYKDPEEFKGWKGERSAVMTVSQSMQKRLKFCGFQHFIDATGEFPRMIFGPDNEDTGYNGGLLSYEDLKEAYRNYRVYFYTGTYPAAYTLNFVEAFMTGIPIVSIGSQLADIGVYNGVNRFEIDTIIKNGVNGFISDDINELKKYIRDLMTDRELAERISTEGRKTAIELFGKEKIKREWEAFL